MKDQALTIGIGLILLAVVFLANVRWDGRGSGGHSGLSMQDTWRR
jgi:hypothetical protein